MAGGATTATTILVVDDSASMRSFVKASLLLMPRAVDVLEADGALRALRILAQTPVALVVADINMPVVSGIALVREVRADARPAVRDVPVILLTGDKSETLRQRAMEVGANAFLQKPGDLWKLAKLAEMLLTPDG